MAHDGCNKLIEAERVILVTVHFGYLHFLPALILPCLVYLLSPLLLFQ